MAPPTRVELGAPTGIKLEDGFSSRYAFNANENVSFWEKEVTPPGLDLGDAIGTSTMQNLQYRTKAKRQLIDVTDGSITVAYNPLAFSEIVTMMSAADGDAITIWWPDLSNLTFFGFLKSFEPQGLTEGGHPESSVVIVVTNWDPVNDIEAGPVYEDVSGT